mgnify:CR=1 FL=1
MTSREECEKAYLYLLKHCYEATKKNDTYDFAPSGFKESEVFKQLIEEHFEPKENTEEYKHFKLHSDSSLKNLTKVELIDYIKMLYHNWGISNDELRRHLYFIEPYNFEDLKVGMWILDRKPQYEEYTFIKIIKILSESDCEYLYHDKDKKIFFDNMECSAREFEENRFFPVQYANLIKMEVKK